MNVSRTDLQVMAEAKVFDAKLLYEAGRFSNAYYLFGYGAELALKARIARAFQNETIPDLNFVRSIFTHQLNELVAHAGLGALLTTARQKSPSLDSNWAVVSEWTEQSRYEIVDQFRAQAMYGAMLAEEDGVFGWLRSNW